ncbi:MAG: T9SS type A sorting domain-containing protein [Bacteroidia bacterium]
MKKITCLLIASLFISVIVHSQNTCIIAKKLSTSGTIDTIPPVGTISPVGPDLGCLTTTERQLWYYIPACENMYIMNFNINCSSSFNDTVGAIIYGPFSQKVSNCSDLTAAKILACEADLFSFQMFFYDTLLEGNYYYLLITFSDAITGNASVSMTCLCGFPTCYECNNQVSVIHQNNLCLVSVDTAINKCILTWEEFPGTNLAGYTIMRETSLTGLYDSLTTIPLGNPSTYTDMTSSPAQHNVTYKIIGSDSCGQHNTLQYSPELTSIHLISFAGGNNQANLIWNNIYTNNNFIPQYYIHRNNNGAGWQLIDSIGVTLPTITYTDIFAPAGINQYTVELVKTVPCIPMRTSSTPYQSVFSNTSIAIVTGTEEFLGNVFFRISPNPANEYSVISGQFKEGDEIRITDVLGKTLFTKTIAAPTINCKLQTLNFSPGMYFVTVSNEKESVVKKLVKQ